MNRPTNPSVHSHGYRSLLCICGALFLCVLPMGVYADTPSPPDGDQSWAQDTNGNVDQSNQVRLLWTNDTHGYFMPVYHAEQNETDSYAAHAATEGTVGGYAYIESIVKKLKPQRLNALFMDSGDTFDGAPVAQMTRGQAVIPVLNAMGYDAYTPGNRDFAYGKADFLNATSKIAIPIVSSTLRDATTGKLVFAPYLIKQLPTLKVAIIGLTHPLITTGFALGQSLAPNGAYAGFNVADEMTALVANIRATEHPDLVVALSHFGYPQDVKFAALQSGVDVILGAHTHHNVFDPTIVKDKNGHDVIVVQAGSHGKFLGDLDVTVKNQTVVGYRYHIIRVVDKKIKPDPAVLAAAEQAYAPFKDYLDRVIGTTTTTIVRRGDTQSTMANLLTDAWASAYGVDISRHFGIRYGSTIIPGAITVGDVWNMVSPNIGNNGIYVGAVNGNLVLSALNTGLNQEYGPDPWSWPGGDVTRFNHNVKYTYNVNAPDNQHIVDLKIGNDYLVQNGQTIPANVQKTYTYASSFPAGPSTPQVPNTTAVDEIVNYIQVHQTVSPVLDDRAVRLDQGPNPAGVSNVGVSPDCYSWSSPGCEEHVVTGSVNGGPSSE